ncbi:MAG: hypothetical protein LAN83_09565 [Acidobacteriia bacterium]|nr:hypothetical protein [Terriglobia bacterium]
MAETNGDSKGSLKSLIKNKVLDVAVFISLLALFAYFWQACIMRRAMRVDQRAWVSIPFPVNFPLNGTSIPANTQIKNSGKTPAKNAKGDVIATIFSQLDKPTIGDFSVGHPHEQLETPGVIFPDAPVPVSIYVGTYHATGKEVTTVDEALRQDIYIGKRFILFYGRINYSDVYDIQHWTQFCTGSGSGIPSDLLKECLRYNDVDTNEE